MSGSDVFRALAVLAALALVVSVPGAVLAPGADAAGTAAHAGLQWGPEQVRAPSAWPTSTGEGATVAVIDSGVDRTHPDLADRVVGGATFIGCPQRSQGCGDGGWRDGGEAFDGDDPNADGHGTHVAGIALAGGAGTAGVAPDARLLTVKALRGADSGQTGGGTTAEVAAGIRWAVDAGADVVNLSLAAPPGSQALRVLGPLSTLSAAIAEAADAGVVVVAAAGNDFAGLCSEPAFDRSAVCVVATDRAESRALYSNLAVSEDMNVVAAPGGAAFGSCAADVLSTWPSAQAGPCSDELGTPGYAAIAGTSMAAPHVAGVAALLRAQGRPAAATVGVLRDTARIPRGPAVGGTSPEYGAGIVDAAAAVATPVSGTLERLAGADRLATAAAVSRRTAGTAGTALLARADDYADALAGAPLAAHLGAPLLLTSPEGLSDAAADELARLRAERVILLGGEAALSARVANDLAARGLTVERIAGANRFDTAARIADLLPSTGEVFVAEGINADPRRGWPDALSASGLAAAERSPVLLVTRDRLPPETAATLEARSGTLSSTTATIVGGPAAVSASVAEEIAERSGEVRRLAGADRYATSAAAVSEARDRGVPAALTWVATGRAFPDGLVTGAAAGVAGGLLVLVDGHDLDRSPATRDLLTGLADEIDTLRVTGGTAAVSTATEQRLRRLAR